MKALDATWDAMPPLPYGPGLAAQLVGELVFQWVCTIVDADALKGFEANLTDAIEDFRSELDPPANLLAKDLILRGLNRLIAEDDDDPLGAEGGVS